MAPSQRAVVGMYSFESPDPLRLATFWGRLMDLPTLEASSDLVMLDFHHEVSAQTWLFQRADAAASSGRIGLDIAIEDEENWALLADRAERLGAERVAQHEMNGARWIEMRDPDGNKFRVFAPRPS